MDYALDPELAILAAGLPKVELSNLASARETGKLLAAGLPKHDTQIPLSVRDVMVAGKQGSADVLARIYAAAERWTPAPTLLYLHAGAYVMGGLAMIDFAARLLEQ